MHLCVCFLSEQVWKVGKFIVGRLDWGGVDGSPRRTVPTLTVRARETYRKVGKYNDTYRGILQEIGLYMMYSSFLCVLMHSSSLSIVS